MRVLMVTPYPPLRDGIAAYAVQMVASLRALGHDIDVLSPGPSAAHMHLDLRGPRGALSLARRVRGYDRMIVQFQPSFFYAGTTAPERAVTDLAIAAAFRAVPTEVVVHEVDYGAGSASDLLARTSHLLWSAPRATLFHSESERDAFVAAFDVDSRRTRVLPHGGTFVRKTRHSRESARLSLGISEAEFVFLCIGFLQRHKGFDRAVRAFGSLAGNASTGARLDIVGSVRVEDPSIIRYRDELADLVNARPGANLHLGFVSDELFDRWVVASDVVVLPYREIWSSGVLERAALYDKPVIATRVGGLEHQARNLPVTFVDDDRELRRAMWSAAGAGTPGHDDVAVPWPYDGEDLASRVQDVLIARARAYRGDRSVAPFGHHNAHEPRAQKASDRVRQVPFYPAPGMHSDRRTAAVVKRVVRILTAWELAPLEEQVRRLQAGTVSAIDLLEQGRPNDGGRSDQVAAPGPCV